MKRLLGTGEIRGTGNDQGEQGKNKERIGEHGMNSMNSEGKK